MGAGVRGEHGGGGKVASLGPYLLARKGGARPAMRHAQLGESAATDEDLGWNDLGEEGPVMFPEPEVKRQQTRLVHHVADSNQAALEQAEATTARRAAFTLRLDEERHLRLRLASTVAGESAQHLVTRALDEFLARHPHIEHLAAQVRKPA
ncbi:hypothetical protein [Alteraurantiacibacter buctensis]|uniref:Uncharacterized protein n=1 Tax=Alteraurantiacibacter buctensis TaxID=1503981 RepID=A0A844Z0E4_9SPHN|nr:hypothetical protein [Alteraurantiacibacter buctensis]MXO73279.1 hypothetical protein [Alteraurantiacibacter buctensis]